MKKITLYWQHDNWMADYHHDEDIRRLFGTTVLPTAFTSAADPQRVLAAIRALNPDADVYLGIGRFTA